MSTFGEHHHDFVAFHVGILILTITNFFCVFFRNRDSKTGRTQKANVERLEISY